MSATEPDYDAGAATLAALLTFAREQARVDGRVSVPGVHADDLADAEAALDALLNFLSAC